eukprot:scaffold6442_cov73-Skeletonema_marinoi.AAC.21
MLQIQSNEIERKRAYQAARVLVGSGQAARFVRPGTGQQPTVPPERTAQELLRSSIGTYVSLHSDR